MVRWNVLSALLALASISEAASAASALMRYPDISATSVVFVSAGDLYIASRQGGTARQLTSHPGKELFPKFSPDGSQIAFSAEYNGTRQVYIMPSDGSAAPKQLTWYNDFGPQPPRGGFDYRVLDFTPDGQFVLVRMNRLGMDDRAGRPYLVPVTGGDEQALPVPETGGGMLSPDGSAYVYTPIDREFRTWKRTRGGRAQDVWIYDLKANLSARLTDARATDNQPMWIGSDIYFTSDRDYTLNLFKMPKSGEIGQSAAQKVTDFKDFDVLWPSAGGDSIVFEQGGRLHVLSTIGTDAGKSQALSIQIPGDRAHTLASWKNVAGQIEFADLAGNAKRVLFSARGELFSVPRKQGEIRQLSKTPNVREMSAVLTSDGQQMAYLSDASGNYELYVRNVDSASSARQLTKDSQAWYLAPAWSRDGKALLLGNSENELWLVTIDGQKTRIDVSEFDGRIETYLFAPDGQSVVYVKANAAGMPEIWAYERGNGRKQRILGGQFDATSPTFDPSGRYLYFQSNRDHNLQFSSYERNYLYVNAGRLFLARLDPSSKAVFAAKSDELRDAAPPKPNDGEAKTVGRIDYENLEARIEALAIPSGTYGTLQGHPNGVSFLSFSNGGGELRYFELASEKVSTIASGISQAASNASGTAWLLRRQDNSWLIAEVGNQPDLSNVLDLRRLEMRVDPQQEWPQLYRDALRVMRTYFYDPGMHGQDWATIEKNYATWLPGVRDRSDLDYILGEIAGELNAGHVYVNRGDEPSVPRKEGGLLGGEFKRLGNGSYEITKIFAGQNWSEEFRSPLTETGLDVRVGDVIKAVNAVPTASIRNFYQLLENQGNRRVELTLERAGREFSVQAKTITSETNLRYLDWIQSRAAMVDKLSGGRIGYVHLPNTAVDGNRELFKQFPSQITKEALIIDDRYNGGGFIPDRMIEILARKPLNHWKRRGVAPQATPLLSHDGPKAMLINGLSSSGGDALPYYFRKLGLGMLIGTRTWGGLIGLSGNPAMADGGSINVADFRFLDTDGKWAVEDEGVTPDIEVIDTPHLLAAGGDPSLERAVKELLAKLPATPKKALQAPPAPTKFGRN